MTTFDWVVVVVVGFSALVGLWRGVVSELLALAAWVAAFLVAGGFSGMLAVHLEETFGGNGVAYVAAFVILFVAVMLLFALLRSVIKHLLQVMGLGPVDRMLGVIFGLIRAAIVLLFLVTLGGMTRFPFEPWWRTARFSPPLETAVLALRPYLPEALATRIRFK